MHFNKRMDQIKQKRWSENPQERQAKIVWQIAYIDSIKNQDIQDENGNYTCYCVGNAAAV